MVTSTLRQSIAARRAKQGDKGFTLIELLVVVLIIGILAAIAIPVFLGQQNSARDGATKSDLANAKLAVIGYATQNNSYLNGTAQLTSAELTNYGFSQSGTYAPVVFANSSGAFCISEKSDSGNWYKVLSTGTAITTTTKDCTTVTG